MRYKYAYEKKGDEIFLLGFLRFMEENLGVSTESGNKLTPITYMGLIT